MQYTCHTYLKDNVLDTLVFESYIGDRGAQPLTLNTDQGGHLYISFNS